VSRSWAVNCLRVSDGQCYTACHSQWSVSRTGQSEAVDSLQSRLSSCWFVVALPSSSERISLKPVRSVRLHSDRMNDRPDPDAMPHVSVHSLYSRCSLYCQSRPPPRRIQRNTQYVHIILATKVPSRSVRKGAVKCCSSVRLSTAAYKPITIHTVTV